MKWLPKWKAVTGGIVVSGFGLSATIFNAIQTFYINPINEEPNTAPYPDTPKEKYFTQQDLLERVPYSFLILGGTYAVMQLIGCVFLVDPPPPKIYVQLSQNDDGPIQEDSKSTTLSTKQQKESPSHEDVKPLKMLLRLNFYLLWIMFMLAGLSTSFLTSLYKQFGLEEFGNDHFLSAVGSVSSVFNLLGRLLWGLLADIVTYKFALVLEIGFMTFLLFTLFITTAGGHWMFLFWMCGLYFCIGGNFSLFPASIARSFGQKYVGVNYGLLFTSQIVGSIISALLASQLVTVINWWGMFFVLSGLTSVGLLTAICYQHDLKWPGA